MPMFTLSQDPNIRQNPTPNPGFGASRAQGAHPLPDLSKHTTSLQSDKDYGIFRSSHHLHRSTFDDVHLFTNISLGGRKNCVEQTVVYYIQWQNVGNFKRLQQYLSKDNLCKLPSFCNSTALQAVVLNCQILLWGFHFKTDAHTHLPFSPQSPPVNKWLTSASATCPLTSADRNP